MINNVNYEFDRAIIAEPLQLQRFINRVLYVEDYMDMKIDNSNKLNRCIEYFQ